MKNLTKKNSIIMFAEGDAPLERINGTQYRKMIAKYGKWVNPLFPIETMELDKEWATKVKANFDAKVIDRVPVPLNHTDDVSANTGEVVELQVEDDALYGILEIRDWQTVGGIEDGLIFDVSISFDWNYVDTEKGQEHGPVLLHVALVNNPYLKGMTGFERTPEQIAQDNAEEAVWGDVGYLTDFSQKHKRSAIMLSESKAKELREAMLVTVKNDKAFAVTITVKDEDGEPVEKVLQPGEEVQVPQDQSEDVLKTIADATDGDGGEEETAEEKAAREAKEAEEAEAAKKKEEEDAAAAEEARKKQEEEDANLTDEEKAAKAAEAEKAELADLRKKNARHELSEKYQTLLSAGKITPAQKDKFMALAEAHATTVQLSAGKTVSLSDAVADILMAGPQVVKFSEEGTQKTEEEEEAERKRKAEEDASKKPSETLSDQEKAGMEAVGADPKRMDELAGKYPAMAAALNQPNPKEEKKS